VIGKNGGLWNNYGQGQGSHCNCSGDFLVLELFLNRKSYGLCP
jgi:hypothetical protein